MLAVKVLATMMVLSDDVYPRSLSQPSGAGGEGQVPDKQPQRDQVMKPRMMKQSRKREKTLKRSK